MPKIELARIRDMASWPPEVDLEAALAAYREQGGAEDLDRFLAWLRMRDHIPATLYRELHAADEVALTTAGAHTQLMDEAATIDAAPPPGAPGPLPNKGFDLLGPVGRGAMGKVSVARDRELLRKVAYKQLREELAGNAAVHGRFLTEAQITAQLDHPQIVPVYQMEVDENAAPAMAMKLIQGDTLAERIKGTRERLAGGGSPLDEDSLSARLDEFLRICEALQFAHSKGVLHRDLKPANIMVGPFHEVYVMDWGIARRLKDAEPDGQPVELSADVDAAARTQAGVVVGTPRYMSPEQASGRKIDPRSDQFALGLILHELICLQPANSAHGARESAQRAQQRQLDPVESAVGERVPRDLVAIVNKATAAAPDARYPDVGALAADVRRFQRGEQTVAWPDNLGRRVLRWISNHREVSLALMVSLLLAVALLALWDLKRAWNAAQEDFDHQQALGRLLTEVGRRRITLEGYFLWHEGLTESAASVALHALLKGQPTTGPVYGQADFDAKKPADLMHSPLFGRPASVEWPVYLLAPYTSREKGLDEVRKLWPLRHQLQYLLLRSRHEPAPKIGSAEARERLLVTGMPVEDVMIGLESGVTVVYPGTSGRAADYDPKKRPWYTAAVARRGGSWGTVYRASAGSELLMPFSIALVGPDGKHRGVVAMDVCLERMRDTLAMPRFPSVRGTYLADGGAQILVSGSGAKEATLPKVVRDGILADQSGTYTLRKERVMFVYQRLPSVDMYLVVVVDKNVLYGHK